LCIRDSILKWPQQAKSLIASSMRTAMSGKSKRVVSIEHLMMSNSFYMYIERVYNKNESHRPLYYGDIEIENWNVT